MDFYLSMAVWQESQSDLGRDQSLTKYVYMVAQVALLLIAAPMVPAEAATAHVLTISKAGGDRRQQGRGPVSGSGEQDQQDLHYRAADGEVHIGHVHREGHQQPGRLGEGIGNGVGHEINAFEVLGDRPATSISVVTNNLPYNATSQRRQGQSGEGQRDE